MEQKDSRFAVLIDADNVSPKYIKYILDEVSDQGVATYKRIYGDWTDISKKSWKEQLLRYSINPIQQYSNTNGKNSTDSAMIIDAMDILYSGNVEGFCLVSSDSDFTKLAMTIYHMPIYKELKKILDSGRLGRVNLITMNFGSFKEYNMKNRFFNRNLAGGAMLDIGVYALSFIRWFFDSTPVGAGFTWERS